MPALHQHLADTYALLGQNEDALKHYQIVRDMQSNDTDNMLRMAKLSEKLGLLREAVTILEEARQNNQADPQIMETLGDAYMQSGENEKAIETLKSLQEISPDKKNIYNLAKAADKAVITAALNLLHVDKDKFLRRINEEICSCLAIPAVLSDASV